MSIRFAIATTLLFFALPAFAAPVITISDAHIPPAPGTTGVAYMRVLSDTDDAITGARSDCCSAVEIHTHLMNGDMMMMRRVKIVPLKSGEAAVFAPHGLHVMLIGLKSPLKAGDMVPITFAFAHAPAQTVDFPVAAAPLQDEKQSPMPMRM